MTNSNFASLHAGMLERSSKGNGSGKSYGSGKAVKALMPETAANVEADFSRARQYAPPIRSLLERVADWTVLPEELDGDISRRHNRVSDEVTEARRPVLDLWVPDQPKMPQSGSSSPEVSTISPSVASEKPKRKALTLRLEPDSYNRLHQACAATGRSRQDILFTGMSKYLDLLDARETVESGD